MSLSISLQGSGSRANTTSMDRVPIRHSLKRASWSPPNSKSPHTCWDMYNWMVTSMRKTLWKVQQIKSQFRVPRQPSGIQLNDHNLWTILNNQPNTQAPLPAIILISSLAILVRSSDIPTKACEGEFYYRRVPRQLLALNIYLWRGARTTPEELPNQWISRSKISDLWHLLTILSNMMTYRLCLFYHGHIRANLHPCLIFCNVYRSCYLTAREHQQRNETTKAICNCTNSTTRQSIKRDRQQ